MNDTLVPALVGGSLYALVALGINVVERVTKIVNFAHASFILWAPLSVLILVRQHDVPVWFALIVATLGVVLLALLVEWLAIRPFLQRSTALPWVLSTLGVGIILDQLATYQFSGEPQAFPHSFGLRSVEILGIKTTGADLAVVVTAFALVGITVLLSRLTTTGRQLDAVAEDPDGAATVGVSVVRASQIAMVASALIGAATGFVAAPTQQVGPNLGLTLLFYGFVAAAIGGIGSVKGSLVGGLVLGLVLQLSNEWFGAIWLNTLLFSALLVVYLVRPQGIFGERALRSV